jgi:hypothetical protein
MGECEPCARECSSPKNSPGPVSNDETIIRLGVRPEHVGVDSQGRFYLAPTAVSKSDLHGKNRSYSLLRDAHIKKEDLVIRAEAKNTFPRWENNPVLARARTVNLRAIVDDNGRREICINSDPTTDENDKFGACPAHASALRSENPPPPQKPRPPVQRVEWVIIQAKVGDCFTDIRHADGSLVTLSQLSTD